MRIALLKINLPFYWLFFFVGFFQFVEENRKSVILGGGYGAQNFLAPIQSRDSRVFFKGILSKNQIEEVWSYDLKWWITSVGSDREKIEYDKYGL